MNQWYVLWTHHNVVCVMYDVCVFQRDNTDSKICSCFEIHLSRVWIAKTHELKSSLFGFICVSYFCFKELNSVCVSVCLRKSGRERESKVCFCVSVCTQNHFFLNRERVCVCVRMCKCVWASEYLGVLKVICFSKERECVYGYVCVNVAVLCVWVLKKKERERVCMTLSVCVR